MGAPIAKERKVGKVASVDVYGMNGASSAKAKLPAEIFAIEPNVPVMHQDVNAQLAAARAGTHSTKSRAEVSGGGAKPWRQKGTGRARAGSTRSPIWVGGGIAHGPKPRDYSQRTPKKMVQLALRSALSDRASENRVFVIDGFGTTDPSTKKAAELLGSIGAEGLVLLVVGENDDNTLLAFRNLQNVKVIAAEELNTFDVLKSDSVVFTQGTIPGVEDETPATKRDAAEESA